MPEKFIQINGSNDVVVQVDATADVTINLPASGGVLAAASNQLAAIAMNGATTYSTGTVVISAGNNITLGSNAQTITISGVAAQTVQTQNFMAGTLAGNSTSAGAGYIAMTSGTMTLAGGNNITLSQNGNAVTISAFTQTVQTQNLHNATLAGNSTSAGAGYIQISSGTMTLAGGNNITLSQNGNAVTISAFTQTVQTQNFIGATLAGNSTSAGAGYINMTSGTLTLAGGNNITLSQNGNAVTISAGAGGGGAFEAGMSNLGITSGTSGTVASQIVFVGTKGILLSQSVNGASATLSIDDQQNTFNSTVFGKMLEWAQSSSTLGQNSLYIKPEILHDWVSGSVIKIPVMMTNSSSAIAAHTRGYTAEFAVYTRHATNSTVLTRHYSTSYTLAVSANSNASWMQSMITAVGNSTSYNTLTASSGGINLSSSLHGAREFIMPWATLLAPGEYWFAYRGSSSSAGTIGSLLQISHIIGSSSTQNRLGVPISGTNDGIARNIGLGTYSATTGAIPAGISMTQINQAATWPIVFFLSATV